LILTGCCRWHTLQFRSNFLGVLKDREIVARERLLKAESLAIIGKSLAIVAHDMKTPLVVIGGFTRQLPKKIKNDA
jgi:signal transduction histidine kinase